MASIRSIRPQVVFSLALLSAVAASAHEVAWSRLVARQVGNTAWATGIVLGVFMLGTGAGSLLVAWRPTVLHRPRRAYAIAETLVALGAIAAAFMLPSQTLMSARILPTAGHAASLAVDIVFATVAVLLPAIAMGTTWPLLVAAGEANGHAVVGMTWRAGLVGAVVGVLVGAGVVAPALGFVALTVGAAALNLAVACAAFALLPRGSDTLEPATPRAIAPEARSAAWAFAAAGVLGLGAQSVWNRVLVPYAGVSSFAFAAIVAVYVAGQSAGALWVKRGTRERAMRAPSWALALAPGVALAGLGALSTASSWLPDRANGSVGWMLGTLLAVALVAGPTAVLLGVAQAGAVGTVEGVVDEPARSTAWVGGLGTVLSAMGAVAAALVLLPWVGPRWTLAALGVPGVAKLVAGGARREAAVGFALIATMLAARPGPAYFLGADWDGAVTLHADFGVQDTTGVVLHDLPVEPGVRRLVANGVSYSGDSLFAQRYMRLLAHLPALAARGHERALVICIGTGTTAAALALHAFVSVDAVDISPAVRDSLEYFAGVNHRFWTDPRVHVFVEDGDRFLREGSVRYDVITLEPPPPRAPGGSTLYTLEFYQAAARRLAPGGVLAQWLPLHDMGGWEAAALTRTFLRVFPNASLHLAERNEAVLLSDRGGDALPTDRLQNPGVARDLAAIGLAGVDPVRDTLLAGPAALTALVGDGPVVTAAWPAPELSPMALPADAPTLDAWVDRLSLLATPANRDTAAAILSPAMGPFIRVLGHRGRGDDRAFVTHVLDALLERRQEDPYWQYAHGFGSYLVGRLDALGADGVAPMAIDRARILIGRARAAWEARR